MRVLVTGASGFLGSHLVEHYVSQGHDVVGVDNFSSSSPTSKHAQTFSKHELLHTIDICDAVALETIHKKKFDLVLNFACPASPPRYQAMPVETMMTCTLGMKNVLDIARKDNAILVQASTSEVYGDPLFSPQNEKFRGNVNSYGPRSCYDEGKRSAEALCFDYFNKYNTDARLVRIFNTYGENMDPDDGRVVSNFICQAIRGETMDVYGGGSQTRSFCYVSDLIRAIVAMADLKKNPQTPINIGNPNEFTILELATKIAEKVYGNRPMINVKPLPTDDPLQRCPDITLAKEILHWSPTVSLDEGLDKTISYFKEHVQ